jgi:hypothetical protein
MAKKLAKKQIGGPTTKTVTKSPSGNYKTITKVYNNDNTTGATTTVRRTLKGVINKAPKVSETKTTRSEGYKNSIKDYQNLSDKERAESREKTQKALEGDYKKGGAVKTKTKK